MSLPTSSLTPHTVEKHNHEHPKETQTGSQVPKPAIHTPSSSSSSSGSPHFQGPIIRIGLKGEEGEEDIDTLHVPGFQSPPSPDFKLPRRKNKGWYSCCSDRPCCYSIKYFSPVEFLIGFLKHDQIGSTMVSMCAIGMII